MTQSFKRLMAILSLSVCMLSLQAQPVASNTISKESKPYKVLTSGKQITIKSSKDIKSVMLWTDGGHRLVEQREINASSYSFTIPVNGRFFFLMVGLENGKIYTEKIGIQ